MAYMLGLMCFERGDDEQDSALYYADCEVLNRTELPGWIVEKFKELGSLNDKMVYFRQDVKDPYKIVYIRFNDIDKVLNYLEEKFMGIQHSIGPVISKGANINIPLLLEQIRPIANLHQIITLKKTDFDTMPQVLLVVVKVHHE